MIRSNSRWFAEGRAEGVLVEHLIPLVEPPVFTVMKVAALVRSRRRILEHKIPENITKHYALAALVPDGPAINALIVRALIDCGLVILGHARIEEVCRGRDGSDRLDSIARLRARGQIQGPRPAHAVASHEELLLLRYLLFGVDRVHHLNEGQD